jgi:hypothetical protein
MPAHARHFQPPPPLSSPLPFHKHLETSLARLVTQYPLPTLLPSGGLYAGLLSIVYLFHRLQDILPPDYKVHGKKLLQWRQEYWAQAEKYERELLGDHTVATGIKVRPWRCGIGDDAVVYAALHVVFEIEENDTQASGEVEAFCNAMTSQLVGRHAHEQSKKYGKPASNEWLYGRSGTLFLLRLIRRTFLRRRANSSSDEHIRATLNTIDNAIRAIIKEIVVTAPRPWVWHGKAYLGAVHGSAGIIAQVLLSIKALGGDSNGNNESKKWTDAVEPDILQLLDSQFGTSGNWPSSLPSEPGDEPSDRLLQFCHGSPGIIICLSHILPHYPHLTTRLHQAITLAQPDLYARGLLTKEPCLCHGATGNALALHDKVQRESFLAYATEDVIREMVVERGWMKESDSPEGLYTGLAGRVWVWALGATSGFDTDRAARFPGFDDA